MLDTMMIYFLVDFIRFFSAVDFFVIDLARTRQEKKKGEMLTMLAHGLLWIVGNNGQAATTTTTGVNHSRLDRTCRKYHWRNLHTRKWSKFQ